MLRNYLKIAFRNLLKNRLNSVINLFGLTIGLTCFILIFLYIRYEMSYDGHFSNAEQIYRVAQIHKGDVYKGSDRSALSPAPLAPTLKEEFPEVLVSTTINVREELLSHGETIFYEDGLYADENLFDVFSFPVLDGIAKEALVDPSTIILSQSLAKKYFGDDSPIGKTILLENDLSLTVKGVIENNPATQHFNFDFITSWKNLPFYDEEDVWYSNTSWYSHNYYTYILLSENADFKNFESKLSVLESRYIADRFPGAIKPQWFLQPLTSIHLHSQINDEIGINSDIRYIYLFASIAIIILLLAIVNYVNLATAQASKRGKEVGVRKVIGSSKYQLRLQFFMESLLFAGISFVLALCLLDIILPVFNETFNLTIPFSFSLEGPFLILMLLGVLLVSLLSGWYPALVLSSVNPTVAIKGGILKHFKVGVNLRNVLVVGQFTAAIVLAVVSVIIYQQLQYIQNKKLGYNRDSILYISYKGDEYFDKTELIRAELMKHPQVEKVSFSSYLPIDLDSQTTVDNWEDNENQSSIFIYRNYIDSDYIDLFEMEMIEGKDFSPQELRDSIGNAFILNESAVKALGWTTAVNKKFNGGKVIGVVKDFHFQPFDLTIEPLFMTNRDRRNSQRGKIAIKVRMDDLNKTLADIEATMKVITPQTPLEYHFLDESYSQLYYAERRTSNVMNIFTILALLIACVGLFGLATNHVLQRTKEIGVRKVLGASRLNIINLLSFGFVKLVAISIMIAFPIAWWGGSHWLMEFAYRINLNWISFLLVGLATMGLAFLTISLQSLKAASANPVDSLKVE